MKVTMIGDIHGNFKRYKQILYKNRNNYTIQIGDFGFSEIWSKLKDNTKISAMNHKVLGGNHDDYDYIQSNIIPHYLGDYGSYLLGSNFLFYYVRGALSIDKNYRIPNISWWEQEELSYSDGFNVIDDYTKMKPKIMITHTLPDIIFDLIYYNKMYIPSRTGQLLSNLFEIHQPQLWIYGHMHTHKYRYIKGTHFIGLAEYQTLTFDTEKDIETNIGDIYAK